jgi:hypothetical protein
LKAAERHGLAGWQHDAENDSIRNGDHVINLANIHLEYAAAILRRPGRSGDITPSMARLPSSAIRGRSFGRFDEILYLVEKTSALTLARHRRVRRASPIRLSDSRRKRHRVRCHFHVASLRRRGNAKLHLRRQ